MDKIKKYLRRYFIFSFVIFWIYYLISTSIFTYVFKDPRNITKEAIVGLIAVSWIPIFNNKILYHFIINDYRYYQMLKKQEEIYKELKNV